MRCVQSSAQAHIIDKTTGQDTVRRVGGLPPLCDSRATVDMLKSPDVIPPDLAPAATMDDVSSGPIDDYQDALAMTRYQIEPGHKEIGFIKGTPQQSCPILP